jgi:hypothetical protein
VGWIKIHGWEDDRLHYSVMGEDGVEVKSARIPFNTLQNEAFDRELPWLSLLAEREGVGE